MRNNVLAAWIYLADTPLFWLSLTLAAYLLAAMVYQRSGGNPILLPVLTAVILVIAFLYATDTPYPVYAKHTRSEEHTSELQSLMRSSYAVFCLKKKTTVLSVAKPA